MAEKGGQKYEAFASNAHELLQNGEDTSREVYRAAKESVDKDPEQAKKTWMYTMNNCVKSLEAAAFRITCKEDLSKLKFFGPASIKIASVLWTLHPPEALSTRELADRMNMPQGSDNAAKKDKRKKMDDAGAPLPREGGGRGGAGGRGRGRGHHGTQGSQQQEEGEEEDEEEAYGREAEPEYAAVAAALGQDEDFAGAFTLEELQQMAARDMGLEHDDLRPQGGAGRAGRGRGGGSRGRAKEPKVPKPRVPKEYAPKVGTANYAFLVTLYISYKQGIEFETKSSLMQKADASGLADKSLFGNKTNNALLPGEQFYDGWSSFSKSLLNRTPPLVQAWSSPKKVRLTPEGVPLAARMYKDALARGKVAPIPGIDPDGDIPHTQADGEEEGLASPLGRASQGGVGTARDERQAMVALLEGRGSQGAQRASGGTGAGMGARAETGAPRNNRKAMVAILEGRGSQGAWAAAPRDEHKAMLAVLEGRGSQGAQAGARAGTGTGAPRDKHAEMVAVLEGRGSQLAGGQRGGQAGPNRRRAGMNSQQRDSSGDERVPGPGEAGEDGMWGGRLRPDELGFLYGSDEGEDPYGYGLGVREEEQRSDRKRSRFEEGRGTGMDGQTTSQLKTDRNAGVTAHVHGSGAGAAGASTQRGGSGGSQQTEHPKAARTSSADIIVITDSDNDDEITGGVSKGVFNSTGTSRLPATAPGPEDLGAAKPRPRLFAPAAAPASFASGGWGVGPGMAARNNVLSTGTSGGVLGSQPGMVQPGAAVAVAAKAVAPAKPVGLPPRASAPATSMQRAASGVIGQERAENGGGAAGSQLSGGSAGGTALERRESSQVSAGDSGTFNQAQSQPYRWMLPVMADMEGQGHAAHIRMPPLPPGQTFNQTYEVVLLVDQREQFQRLAPNGQSLGRMESNRMHLDQIRAHGLAVLDATLAIGDSMWVARQRSPPHAMYVLSWVLERKSCQDLLNSIQSKQRFHKQKHWLRQCGLEVMYLIEGNPDKLAMTVADNKTIKTVLQGNELDGFRVLRTGSANDTVALLARLTHAITRLYTAHGAAPGKGASETDRDDSREPELFEVWNKNVSARKADGVRTVRDVWGCMLAAIPGMGPNTIEAILTAYPTARALNDAYQKTIRQARQAGRNPVTDACDLLSQLPLPSGTGRVGQGRSRAVYELLFMEGTDVCPAQV